MSTILDFPSYSESRGVLPRHPSAAELLRETLGALAPPTRLTVDEAAAAHRRTRVGMAWQEWSNEAAPYLVEPQRMITSRRYAVVCFVGPAQSLKTTALIENPIAHAIVCQPRPVHVVQMSRDAAREFSIEKIGPMIRNSPDLEARRALGKGADNTFDKVFRQGMRLSIGWPVVSQLSSRSIPLMLLTDYDRMPENVDGEGSPLALARNRPKAHGSLGKVVLEGSPGRPVLRDDIAPSGPHEAPPTTGIMAEYNSGTRARWYVDCSDCGEPFEPRYDRLTWPKEAATPAEAGRRAGMTCPHCGVVHGPERKTALNATGRWLHETRDGSVAPLGDETRESDIVSYWLQGPAAALSRWADIVTQVLNAEAAAERTGDELPLAAVMNTQVGVPYLSRALRDEDGLNAEQLKSRAEPRPLGIAPKETRFITVAVDVQANRFVVQVDAWGPDMRSWLIDRFDIHEPPAEAPRAGERALDPARYKEDWAALLPLMSRSYPIEGCDQRLLPEAVAFDTGGPPGVTDNAYRFWRGRRKAGEAKRWRGVRPRGGTDVERAWLDQPKRGSKGRQAARDVTLLFVGSDRLKDAVSASLTRETDGPGAYRLPATLPDAVYEEFAAERWTPKGWELKPGVQRNEALDLRVYSLGLTLVLGAERIDWDAPPDWAAELRFNPRAIGGEGAARRVAQAPAARPKSGPTGADAAWISPNDDWLTQG
ncbi:MAG: terminase gpA endonuclease subunit [Pseudomonadota bacterium]